MNKKTSTRTVIASALAAAFFVTASANDAAASASTQSPSQVTHILVPEIGINAENLNEQLKPLGFSKVYALKEKNGFFHLMAEDHHGDLKRLWVGKSDGKTAIF
ncbi:MAG: hypothetical protein ISR45_06095 [Rhodospirillales bacterium]|nr:hypothetical protein [Rhodospirillales bacterium]